MSNANDDQPPATAAHDRRAFLQHVGLGAAAVGAWVAPQVLFTSSAAAACSPIVKLLQVGAAFGGAQTTTFSGSLPTCHPTGWAGGRNDGVTFTIAPASGLLGAVITITSPGCVPTAGKAVKRCGLSSPSTNTCIDGTVSGSTITFPTISFIPDSCRYVEFRIRVECCI